MQSENIISKTRIYLFIWKMMKCVSCKIPTDSLHILSYCMKISVDLGVVCQSGGECWCNGWLCTVMGVWQQCVGSGGAGSKRLFLCFTPITHLSNPIMPWVRQSQRGVEMPGSSSLNGAVRAEWKCVWFSLHLIWVSVVRVPKPSP